MSLRWAIVLSIAIGSFMTAFAPSAQPRGRVPRLGVLEPGTPGGGCLTGFRQGLSDLGYVEGKTIVVDYRFANGDPLQASTFPSGCGTRVALHELRTLRQVARLLSISKYRRKQVHELHVRARIGAARLDVVRG
jgi:hypothetical protein